MKVIDLSTDEEKKRTFFKVLGLASLAVIAATGLYGIAAAVLEGVEVVGETLVTIEFPPISAFPLFYSKPVTWLAAAIVALWFSVLELGKTRITRFSGFTRSILRFFAFFVAAMAAYEVLFNFTLWSGLIARDAILGQLNVDIIRNTYPNPKTPWNIVFATKMFAVLTIISSYAFYFLQRLEPAAFRRAPP